MKKLIILALAFLFILPTFVRAQTVEVESALKYIATVIFGFPETWTVGNYFWYGLIPFFGAWLIMYGFLAIIRIFGDRTKLYVALSFFIIFSTLPLGWFALFVTTMFQVMGVWSIIIFIILFFAGTIFALYRGIYRGYKRAGVEKKELDKFGGELQKVDNAIKKEYSNLGKETDPAKKEAIIKNIADLQARRKKTIENMGDIARI
jgi:hypothetical protein